MDQKEELRRLVEDAFRQLGHRKLIVAGNWKMNMTLKEAFAFLDGLSFKQPDREVLLFPPATLLLALSGKMKERRISYGPQNVHHQPGGAYTGEISIPMIEEIGCTAALIGHSERRQYFGETDAEISRKAKALLDKGITPIICIGETLERREADCWKPVLELQIRGGLNRLLPEEIRRVIFAYEPVWAIGTGVTASNEEIAQAHQWILSLLKDSFGVSVPVLYGGSVNEKNAVEIGGIPGVGGFLIGGASLDSGKFSKIIGDCGLAGL